jgi:peptide/nickel transport system substrate-binding protein
MKPDSEKSSWMRFRHLKFSQKALSRNVKKVEKNTRRHARRFVSSRLDRLSAVRRQIFGWAALVMILVCISLVQWFSFRGSYATVAASAGGTYSEGVLGPLETLNPIYASSSAEKSVARLLFASLYNYDETGNLKGDVAESIAVNEAETEYTVKLHSGMVWSDGEPLTAADVVFTVDLLKDPTTQAGISGWQLFKAEALDARTVKFTLPTTYAPFIHTLTFPILPKHVLGDVKPSELREQPFSQSPVTSGPFSLRMLQKINTDNTKMTVHLIANTRYFHGAPKLERFQLNVYPTRDDIIKALKTSEIMATPEVSSASVPDDVSKIYKTRSYTINDGVYAVFNTTSEVLNNLNVRQALALSVDRDDLRSTLSRSTAPLDGPVLPSQVSEELPSAPARDIPKAKALLDQEGWVVEKGERKKDGKTLTLRMVAPKGSDFSQTVDELAAIWRKELNIKVDVQIIDPLDMSQNFIQAILQPRNFDILVYEFVIGGDPDVFAYWHSSQANPNGRNFANYNSILASDALAGGRAKLGDKYRSSRYVAFTRRWMSDVPAIALYQPKIDYIQSNAVSSMADDARLVYAEDRYANVIYWTVERATVYKTP